MNKESIYRATPIFTDIRQARQRLMPTRHSFKCCREYAHERPKVDALWCFGIGFVPGWKLKPW